MSESVSRPGGAVTTLTKHVSDADVALYLLVTGQTTVTPEETPIPPQVTRQIAPMALVASILAGAAARHGLRPGAVRFLSETVRYLEPAYTEDTLTATAVLVERDPASRNVRIVAHCENQEGRRLAEGEFILADV